MQKDFVVRSKELLGNDMKKKITSLIILLKEIQAIRVILEVKVKTKVMIRKANMAKGIKLHLLEI
jgi:NACalpha-BTF3-like transcription factor